MPTDPKHYIAELIKAHYSTSPHQLAVMSNFLNDPLCSSNLQKIMRQAHKEILDEWERFQEPKPYIFPRFEEEPASPVMNSSSPPSYKIGTGRTTEGNVCGGHNSDTEDSSIIPPQSTGPRLLGNHQSDTPQRRPVAPSPSPAAQPPIAPVQSNRSSPGSTSSRTVATSPAAPKSAGIMNISFRLQNAMVGVPYTCAIQTMTPNAPDIVIIKIDGLTEVGLQFDSFSMQVVGSPAKSGDFVVIVWYSILGGSEQIASKCNLTINPDPKSLWRNIPSDQEGLYPKPDEDVCLITSPDHILAGASKRGRSHAHTGIYRDDDFFIAHVEETGWDVSIVSDGAGSCEYSRRGSQLICKSGGARLRQLLAGDDGKKLADVVADYKLALESGHFLDAAERAVRNALWTTIGYAAHHATKCLQDETASRADLKAVMKDYSSTAIIGIAKKFSFGTLCAAYWVGDGAIAVLKVDGTHILLGDADSGEFSGQTRFLGPELVQPEELARRLRFALVPDFKALIMMTDGVSDPCFETDAGLNDTSKWKAFWEELDASAELSRRDEKISERLLMWLDFWSAGNHDDRTLALIF